jgi:hypothetical protein
VRYWQKNYTNSWERQRYLWALLENIIKKTRRRQRKYRKARNVHGQRCLVLSMLDNSPITEADFRRMFRMDCESFFEVVERIDGIIQKDAQRATNSSRLPIRNL